MRKILWIIVLVALLGITGSQVAAAAPEFQGGNVVYYVVWGDSLTGIAARYGVSIEAIMRQNGLSNPNMIYVGQPLVIPGGVIGPGNPGGCVRYHIVRPGDTLSGIAWDYNTTLYQLLQVNNLYNKDILYVGQQICVPGGYAPQPGYPQPPAPPPATYYHVVAPGETLSGIAFRYGVNYWTIMQANNLTTTVIWVGQQLIIPGYQSRPCCEPPQPPQPPQPRPRPRPAAWESAPPVYEGQREEYPIVEEESVVQENTSQTPSAPAYEPSAARPSLPVAEHPVEVVVNGGENWVDDVYPAKDDPNSITTLIVQTGEENGKTVRVRSGDAESKGESSFNAEFGAYRFVFRYIPPGDYDVWVDDPNTPSEIARVKVGAGQRVEVAFRKGVGFQGQTYASPDGWVLSGFDNPSKPHQDIGGWSNILIKTPASGLNIIAESEGGGYKAKCFTGSKGPGMCDFAGLRAGIYYIWIDGTQLKLKTYMDGAAYATFEFAHQ
jgi:LysM repeat protein